MTISQEIQQALLDAARVGIREALRGNTCYAIPETADPVLSMPAGCFVTLHEARTHRLRGCIGALQSPEPLIRTVHRMAHQVIHDPRFVHNPVTIEELPRLALEISVLSPLAAAADPLDFDLANDGIYVICQGRTGTFLPQVARDTGWSKEQLLDRLCADKMGLAADAWRGPDVKMFRYQAMVIGPVPFVKPVASAPPAGTILGGSGFGSSTFKI